MRLHTPGQGHSALAAALTPLPRACPCLAELPEPQGTSTSRHNHCLPHPWRLLRKSQVFHFRFVSWCFLTSCQEGGQCKVLDYILQGEALLGDQDGNKRGQGVVEGQATHLEGQTLHPCHKYWGIHSWNKQ